MKTVGKIFMWFVYVIMYAPIVVMIVFSFNDASNITIFKRFSFRQYGNLFNDTRLLEAVMNTLTISVAAAAVASALGVIAAYGIYRIRSKKLKSAFNTVTNIPLTNPDIITGVSLRMLFTFCGALLFKTTAVLGFWTLLIAHVTFDTPYVILNVLPRLYGSDPSLYEAAMDLGCTKSKAFWKIIFPGLVPGIISGFIMAFTLSIDDFIISYYTNGHFEILPTKLYTAVKQAFSPEYYALYTLIFLGILILMLTVNVMQYRSERKNEGGRPAPDRKGTSR